MNCMPIGPSIPCACHATTPLWVDGFVFARKSYMQGAGDGKSVYWWWEWVRVTPAPEELQ